MGGNRKTERLEIEQWSYGEHGPPHGQDFEAEADGDEGLVDGGDWSEPDYLEHPGDRRNAWPESDRRHVRIGRTM